jgi:mRNA-degrading endonuclease toxin of MazEF toxin-antitoxin module
MKRGEVWTASGGAPYAGKPLITTVPKARLGKRIGKLNDEDVVRLNRALTVFLGLAR